MELFTQPEYEEYAVTDLAAGYTGGAVRDLTIVDGLDTIEFVASHEFFGPHILINFKSNGQDSTERLLREGLQFFVIRNRMHRRKLAKVQPKNTITGMESPNTV